MIIYDYYDMYSNVQKKKRSIHFRYCTDTHEFYFKIGRKAFRSPISHYLNVNESFDCADCKSAINGVKFAIQYRLRLHHDFDVLAKF